ncbi:hypothetical protein SAMN02745131_00675 [Flavisolibacter ginsengisoli DSM 18119]|uniref:Uncharacterized protein n=2 Tax=Flavisolibacter TaxID=398041 RepID=A0A1M4UIX1_9BACT|nr:hypothetical protein SAMN02745131_00675 [Flavisolibacter ginsengisoli DSM 18119]
MNNGKYVLFIFCFLAAYCSPMRKINIKNRSGGDVDVTWKLKDLDSLYLSPFFLSNSKTVAFHLKSNKPYNDIKMSFGMGSWPKDSLYAITERLESLEIKSHGGTIFLDSSDKIFSFLYHRRKGIGNRKIEILITK